MEINTNTSTNNEIIQLNTKIWLMLLFSGVLLGYLVWCMLPINTTLKVILYLLGGVLFILAPMSLTEYFLKNNKNMSQLKASIQSILIVIAIPVLLHIVYYAKYDSVVTSIPVSNQIKLKVDIKKNMLYNNSVGNDWFFDISVNSDKFNYNENSKSMIVSGSSTIKVDAQVTESDSIPDRGKGSLSIDVKNLDFKNGSIFSIPIKVRENRGRYSGNTAEWEIAIIIKRDVNFWDIVLG